MLILRTENYIAFQKSIFLHVHMKLHQNAMVYHSLQLTAGILNYMGSPPLDNRRL